jgi:hypothetical protein
LIWALTKEVRDTKHSGRNPTGADDTLSLQFSLGIVSEGLGRALLASRLALGVPVHRRSRDKDHMDWVESGCLQQGFEEGEILLRSPGGVLLRSQGHCAPGTVQQEIVRSEGTG